jgi:hypothetical protein
MSPPCASRTVLPGRSSRRTRKRSKLKNPADAVARVGRHPNPRRSAFARPLFDIRRIPSSRLRKATAARMRRSDLAGGGRLRSCRRRRGAVLPRRSPEHDGLHSVVLIDVRRIPSGRLRTTAEARMRRIDFAGGGRLRSRRRRHGVVLPMPPPEPRRSAFGRAHRRPPDPFRSPSDDRRGSNASHRLRRWRAPSVSSSSPWWGASKAVIRTTMVCLRSSSSTCCGSLPVAIGRPRRLVCVASTW